MKPYNYQKKVLDLKELKEALLSERKLGATIVFTNGCFDILHKGHIHYLRMSRELGDVLVVGINSDKSVKRIKGDSRPINNEIDRALVLEAFDFIDYIVIFEDDTPLQLIMELKPDIYTKGGDYNTHNIIGPNLGSEIIESYGGKVILVDVLKGYSSSSIILKARL